MAISIELPDEIERSLHERIANLDLTAKEAVLVDLYRQQQLSHRQLSQALARGVAGSSL